MNEAEQVHGEFYIPTFTEMKDSSASEKKQQICETSHSLESHFDSAFHATPEQVCPTVKIHPCEQSDFVGDAENELNLMPFRTRSHSMPMLNEQQVALALRRISDDFNSVYDLTTVSKNENRRKSVPNFRTYHPGGIASRQHHSSFGGSTSHHDASCATACHLEPFDELTEMPLD